MSLAVNPHWNNGCNEKKKNEKRTKKSVGEVVLKSGVREMQPRNIRICKESAIGRRATAPVL